MKSIRDAAEAIKLTVSTAGMFPICTRDLECTGCVFEKVCDEARRLIVACNSIIAKCDNGGIKD